MRNPLNSRQIYKKAIICGIKKPSAPDLFYQQNLCAMHHFSGIRNYLKLFRVRYLRVLLRCAVAGIEGFGSRKNHPVQYNICHYDDAHEN